jgi:phosphate-selective porin
MLRIDLTNVLDKGMICERIRRMKIELTPDAAQWVEAALAAGRFLTAEDAIRHAVNQVKTAELRAALDAAEAEGGRFTTGEVRQYARDHLDRLKTPAR